MNCPRCKTSIPPLADPDSIVTCPGCGSRLMTRSAAIRSQGGSKAAASGATKASAGTPAPPVARPVATSTAAPPGLAAGATAGPPSTVSARTSSSAAVSAAELPPSATLPPTPARLLGLLRERGAPSLPRSTAKADGSKRKGAAASSEGLPELSGAGELRAGDGASVRETLDLLVREVRALQATQAHILELLGHGRGAAPPVARVDDDADPDNLSPIRARQRKTVVLIDDDPATRAAAVAELQQADVPVRAFADGNAALSGIAEEKPDVIVLELGLGGDMAGKDVINMVKATMEWVDLPIVLWTREPVNNQKEARQIHGADEIVPKSAGAGALLARVITLFRRM
jgi:CheY-like chemotaxis protein